MFLFFIVAATPKGNWKYYSKTFQLVIIQYFNIGSGNVFFKCFLMWHFRTSGTFNFHRFQVDKAVTGDFEAVKTVRGRYIDIS